MARAPSPSRTAAGGSAARSGDLRARVLSSIVLAPIVLAAVWWGGVPFLVLLLLVAALATDEWVRLLSPKAATAARYGLGVAVAALVALPLVDPDIRWLAEVALVVGLVFALLGARISRNWNWWALSAVLYVGLPAYALVWLRAQPGIGLELLVYLLVVVWATDIGAYFTGKTLGGPKLAPRISPKKTWSGLIGGMVAGGIAGGAVAAAFGAAWPVLAVLLGMVLAAVGQAGDLFESHMKRRAGVKDSGRLIPGHGGILDRIDGLIAAAAALAAFHASAGSGFGWW